MKSSLLRVYLTGGICAEWGSRLRTERELPGKQARLLFAYLVADRSRPVSREELGEALWPQETPPQWEGALNALVSKVRHFVAGLGCAIESQFGCYQIQMPPAVWIDLEAARHALDEAEGALRAGKVRAAWGAANVAITIARRGFLPGEQGRWVEKIRGELLDILLRGLDGYAEVCVETGQATLAVQMAEEALSLDPFRETSYRRMMRAHAALGNRAEAIRVYHRCRETLSEELGVDPAPETEAVYLEILRQTAAATASTN